MCSTEGSVGQWPNSLQGCSYESLLTWCHFCENYKTAPSEWINYKSHSSLWILAPAFPLHQHTLKVEVSQLCPTLCDPIDCTWNSPGQNNGVGCHSLLQGIFPNQGSNPGLLQCRQILYHLSHEGSPRILEWVAYPFSSESSQLRNRTRVPCITGGFFTSWDHQGSHVLTTCWFLPTSTDLAPPPPVEAPSCTSCITGCKLISPWLDQLGFPGGSEVKVSASNAGAQVQSLDQEDPLEKGMATHSSILAWKIPWREEPGRLQSTGSWLSDPTEQLHFELDTTEWLHFG